MSNDLNDMIAKQLHYDKSSEKTSAKPSGDASEPAEGEAWGYVGTGSAEEQAADAARKDAQVNSDEDQYEATNVAPTALGRAVDADFSDMELSEGDEIGMPGSRVGFATVEHPRVRQADALHDQPNDGRVGRNAEGSVQPTDGARTPNVSRAATP